MAETILVSGRGQAMIISHLADERSNGLVIEPEDDHRFDLNPDFVYLACNFDYKKECGFKVNATFDQQRIVSYKDGHKNNYENKSFEYQKLTTAKEFQDFATVEQKGDKPKPVVIRLPLFFYRGLISLGYVTVSTDKSQQQDVHIQVSAKKTPDMAAPLIQREEPRSDVDESASRCSIRAKCLGITTVVLGAAATLGFFAFRNGGWLSSNNDRPAHHNPPGLLL